MRKPNHILVIRFSAMGDVAMMVPVIRALTEQYPEVKLTILTRAFFKPIFRDLRNVTVYTADLKGKHNGILGLYKLSRDLKVLKFDAIADLHNVLRSKILKFFFTGQKVVQIDKGRTEKKALTSGKLFHQLKTTHQRYADVFKVLGYPVDISQSNFPKKVKLGEKLKTFIIDAQKPVVGIAPFAAHKGKMYPLHKMEIVIEQLSKTNSIVLFGGGNNEVSILNQIEGKYKNVASVAGKLTLDEELNVISNLNVMLSMDSGNAHLAAMMGIKVVTIWGVTHPYAGFAPFNQPKDYMLLADRAQFPLIPTSIYGNKYPETYEDAAGSILTDTVIRKVNGICQVECRQDLNDQ